MSTPAENTQNNQNLRQELENELTRANQLLQDISSELLRINEITNEGGEFEECLKENAVLAQKLAYVLKANFASFIGTAWADQNEDPENHVISNNTMDDSQ